MRFDRVLLLRSYLVASSLVLLVVVPMAQASPEHSPRTCNGTWTIEPNPAGPGSSLYGVTGISSTDVWAVGNQGVGKYYVPLVEHWDGASWTLADVPHPSKKDTLLYGVSGTASDDVWAVGYTTLDRSHTLIEHWDGTAWSVVPSPNPGSFASRLFGVAAIAPTDAWAVGEQIQSTDQALIVHWDGATWSVVDGDDLPGDFSYLTAVSGDGPDDVWAVGGFTNGHDGVTQALTEHWNGTDWQGVQAIHHQSKANVLTGVAVLSSSSALATGFRHDGTRTFGVSWDGLAWSPVNTERVGETINSLNSVSADTGGDAWTAGYYYIPGDSQAQTLIEQWDGSAWQIVPSPNDGATSALYGVATVSATEAWAVGQNGSNAALIERYCV